MRAGCLLAAAMMALCGCQERQRVGVFTGEAMGTTYRIKYVGDVEVGRLGIGALCDRLDHDLSTWRADSWVSEFNRAAAGATREMPDSVAHLLELSRRVCLQTDGRFDPTVGALVRLWGFGAWGGDWRGEPTDEEVAEAREAGGFRNLRMDGKRLTKLHSALMLDFSGIAKGYAVDLMGALLRDAGCQNFIIEFGGEVLASGSAPGKQGWTVFGPALGRPRVLCNEAIATSGSEHHYRGGLSHVIDPRSGSPVAVGPAVSASAATCAEADALATARLVGPG